MRPASASDPLRSALSGRQTRSRSPDLVILRSQRSWRLEGRTTVAHASSLRRLIGMTKLGIDPGARSLGA